MQLADDRGEPVDRDVHRVDRRPLGGEGPDDGPPDAAGRTGDEGDPASKAPHQVATRPTSMRSPIPVVNDDWSEAR